MASAVITVEQGWANFSTCRLHETSLMPLAGNIQQKNEFMQHSDTK